MVTEREAVEEFDSIGVIGRECGFQDFEERAPLQSKNNLRSDQVQLPQFW